MGLDNGHTIESSLCVAIWNGAEVSPVYLTLLSGGGFKTDKGASFFGSVPDLSEVVPEYGDFPVKSEGSDTLKDDHG